VGGGNSGIKRLVVTVIPDKPKVKASGLRKDTE
jgi:hypothetical protein